MVLKLQLNQKRKNVIKEKQDKRRNLRWMKGVYRVNETKGSYVP